MKLLKEIVVVLVMVLLLVVGESYMLILIAIFGLPISIGLLTAVLFCLTCLVGLGRYQPQKGRLYSWVERNIKESFLVVYLLNIIAGPLVTVLVVRRLTSLSLRYSHYFFLSFLFSALWLSFYNLITGGVLDGVSHRWL